MNIVALRGRLSRPAEERILGSGTRLVAYEVTVPDRNGGRAETVPVVWFDAPTGGLIDGDTEVVVVGRVRRRFFRAGGATGSRTEVVADTVIPASRAKRVATALERAQRRLAGEEPSG